MGAFIALTVIFLLWRGERRAIRKARQEDDAAALAMQSGSSPAPQSTGAHASNIVTVARIVIKDNTLR